VSTNSSRSNEPSNSSNSFSKPKFIWINLTKLKGNLHPSIGSLGQFLLKKIKFSKVFYCKQYLLTFVSMHVKENFLSISIWNPTMPKIWQAKKPIVGNMASCFPHHWRGHLISLGSTW